MQHQVPGSLARLIDEVRAGQLRHVAAVLAELAEKMNDDVLLRDVPPLLVSGTSCDPHRALDLVRSGQKARRKAEGMARRS